MAQLVFFAFIIVYAVLVLSHKEQPRAYRLFWFGLLVSVLYASIYSFYADIYLVFILMLTSLAILTQYFHWRAVDGGRAKPMKMLVDIAPEHKLAAKRRR
jgi:ABC-type transport system involved in cytochrome c biogenesis permease subunit